MVIPGSLWRSSKSLNKKSPPQRTGLFLAKTNPVFGFFLLSYLLNDVVFFPDFCERFDRSIEVVHFMSGRHLNANP